MNRERGRHFVGSRSTTVVAPAEGRGSQPALRQPPIEYGGNGKFMEFSAAALQQVRERRLLIDQVDLWLYEEIAPFIGRRVLEIGCGLGNFARHLTDREIYVGIEISDEIVAQFRQLHADASNLHAFVADITDASFLDFGRFRFDTIFSLNVFEHIEDDLLAATNAAKVLQPGGTFILVVPSHGFLYGSMDRSIGHHRRYDKEEVASLLRRAGFTCVSQKYVNAFGALGWLVNGRLLRNEVPPSGQLTFFNHLVPMLKRLERAVSVPFGISLLTVARKPAVVTDGQPGR